MPNMFVSPHTDSACPEMVFPSARDEYRQVGELLRRHVFLERREREREFLHFLERDRARLGLGGEDALLPFARTNPGRSAFTRMPSSPSSIARIS